MFNLGQEIYYADAKEGVKKGVVLGYSVNEQGHDVYSIKSGQSFIVVFSSLCFQTEEEAQKEKSPSNDGLLADEQAVLSIYRMTPPEKRLDFIRQLIALVPDDDQTELAAFVLEAIKTSK